MGVVITLHLLQFILVTHGDFLYPISCTAQDMSKKIISLYLIFKREYKYFFLQVNKDLVAVPETKWLSKTTETFIISRLANQGSTIKIS